MPFGMGPAGWAYVAPYRYPYARFPYMPWFWWCGRRGWGRGVWGPPLSTWPWMPWTKEQEKAFLEEQAKALEEELEMIKKRLEELKVKGD